MPTKKLPRHGDAAPVSKPQDLRDGLALIARVASVLSSMPDVRRRFLAEQLHAAIRIIQEKTALLGYHFKRGAPPGQEARWEREQDERFEQLKAVYERETKKTVQLLTAEPSGETPSQKSARLRRAERILRDQGDVFAFVAQIVAGATTEEARENLGIGIRRAERLRAVAVSMGLLRRRQRKAQPRSTL